MVGIPNAANNSSNNSEPPLKVPKLNSSNSAENTWENSPSSQSSAEWHIPTSNSSSASECAGEGELTETGTSVTQNNVQTNSESSSLSLSRTSFNEGKEIQLPKTLKNDINEESASTETANDVEIGSVKDEQSDKKDDDIDSKIKSEALTEDSKNMNISESDQTNNVLPDNAEQSAEVADTENSPLSDEFWKKQNPLVDHVLITDVTTNLLTVTVRECDTSSGFFKDRPNPGNNENSPKENEENTL